MSRIKPEDLPKPKQVSKKKSKEMLKQFSSTGTSKYDVYVEAAWGLKPGEGLDTLELPENVITSIQKKFREKGLTKAKGWYAISRTTGTEKKGNKTLLIGRYAETPKSTKKRTTRKSTSKARKTTTRKSTSKARKTTARATKASQAKRNAKSAPSRGRKPATAKKSTAAKTTRKSTARKTTKRAASKTTKRTVAKKSTRTARKTTANAKRSTARNSTAKATASKSTRKSTNRRRAASPRARKNGAAVTA